MLRVDHQMLRTLDIYCKMLGLFNFLKFFELVLDSGQLFAKFNNF